MGQILKLIIIPAHGANLAADKTTKSSDQLEIIGTDCLAGHRKNVINMLSL